MEPGKRVVLHFVKDVSRAFYNRVALEGVVRMWDGHALPEGPHTRRVVNLYFYEKDPAVKRNSFSTEWDARGRFRVEGLSPGEWKVNIEVPLQAWEKPQERHFKEVGYGRTFVIPEVPQNPVHLEIVIHDTSIKGRALDAESKQPIEGCSAWLRKEYALGNDVYTWSEEDGTFLLKGAPPGRYWLEFSKKGYRNPGGRRIELSEGDHLDLGDILLEVEPPAGLRNIATLNRYVGDLSDHHILREHGEPYLFLTCGRWEHYHQTSDLPRHLNYAKMNRINQFLQLLIRNIDIRLITPQPEDCDPLEMELALMQRAIGPYLQELGLPMSNRQDIQRFVRNWVEQFQL